MTATQPVRLEYDAERFAIAAREALDARQPFVFEIVGAAWEQLKPFVVESAIPQWASLATRPKLQLLVVVLALAHSQSVSVEVRPREDAAEVYVGAQGAITGLGMSAAT